MFILMILIFASLTTISFELRKILLCLKKIENNLEKNSLNIPDEKTE